MSKIQLDKYYTSPDLAEYCVNKVKELLGDSITEWLEPSAGAGVFLEFLPDNTKAYDIEPEADNIIKQDYLKLDLKYKKGRCVIGNPPYGRGNSLSMSFFKKSIKIADYIAFILPISQLNNNAQLYDFDLIYSEDLGIKEYSGVSLNCCFNIYKRPAGGLNKKPNYKLKDVSIVEYRRDGRAINIPPNYSYAMGTFGGGCVGKEVKEQGKYSLECYFYINNKDLEEDILNVLKNTDWKSLSKGISNTYRLPQWKILKKLKEDIPEIS